mgnify:CR=1 FL=1
MTCNHALRSRESFQPFMVYNTDNQLIIDTISVLQFHKGTIKTEHHRLRDWYRECISIP